MNGIEIGPHAEERSIERVSKHAGSSSSAPSLFPSLSWTVAVPSSGHLPRLRRGPVTSSGVTASNRAFGVPAGIAVPAAARGMCTNKASSPVTRAAAFSGKLDGLGGYRQAKAGIREITLN